MESSLPLPFLVSVALPPGLGGAGEGLTREDVSCLGTVFFDVTPATLDKMLNFLARHSLDLHPYLDVSRLGSRHEIVSLLDAGARMVFVQPERMSELAEFGHRVAPLVVGNQGLSRLASSTEHGLLVAGLDAAEADISQVVEEACARKISPIFLKPVEGADLGRLIELARQCNAVPVLPSTRLTTNKEDTTADGKLSVASVLAGIWSSDRPDGLIPTVVCDENGFALGLVYSSEESVGEALRTRTGAYHSRKRGLWYKGATSGDTQELVRISLDCDSDSLKFVVKQKNRFCHLPQSGCFGEMRGIQKLERTLLSRKDSAPPGSYTARLFSDEKLLRAKIMEEAEELCDAKTPEHVAFEAADLIYFALTRAVGAGVRLADIERSLDAKSLKVKRRTGDAKGKWADKEGIPTQPPSGTAAAPKSGKIMMPRLDPSTMTAAELESALKRPSQRSSEDMMKTVTPIINDVRQNGDKAVLAYTHKFERAASLTSPVLRAPFPESLMELPPETVRAIDVSFENIRKFHAAQAEEKPLQIETMPGVVCSRFARAIEAVGLYVPGGTAVLPSTALMLGVPAMVAGCRRIVLASPPRADGTVTPEIVYVAHKVGAEAIVLAGGAQAVAAMAYGTESIPKVDKIYGPGNQFVTAAKMHVANDANAAVGIDMPAGPSEVLVMADADANPAFVASDLLSQAEHGADSQVVLLAVGMSEAALAAVEAELDGQARALPRVDIVRRSIAHSATVLVRDTNEAMRISNAYAPEHLILQVRDPEQLVAQVVNTGSVFVGPWTPESVGDYSAGVNHSLPTYGYAKQYSGVNLGSFLKHITSSNLTAEGLRNVSEAVMQLAKVEELEAHRRAVSIRLEHMASG